MRGSGANHTTDSTSNRRNNICVVVPKNIYPRTDRYNILARRDIEADSEICLCQYRSRESTPTTWCDPPSVSLELLNYTSAQKFLEFLEEYRYSLAPCHIAVSGNGKVSGSNADRSWRELADRYLGWDSFVGCPRCAEARRCTVAITRHRRNLTVGSPHAFIL